MPQPTHFFSIGRNGNYFLFCCFFRTNTTFLYKHIFRDLPLALLVQKKRGAQGYIFNLFIHEVVVGQTYSKYLVKNFCFFSLYSTYFQHFPVKSSTNCRYFAGIYRGGVGGITHSIEGYISICLKDMRTPYNVKNDKNKHFH